MMKTKYIGKLVIMSAVVLTQCSDPLDKAPLGAISEDVVWSDENLAEGFLNNIYDRAMPGWPATASQESDDAEAINRIMYGEASTKNNYSASYRIIKDINLLLEKVGTGTLSAEIQNVMKGQALFFRARMYFELVSLYGGVPLVLKVSDNSDPKALQVPRNTTSECIAQIIADFDEAISLLPNEYSDAGTDYGRITKGAVLAYKGRVLLHYASEQFDPAQNKGRWQAAYDANKAAKDWADANGKGLHASYGDLWFDEGASNPEAIMIQRYDGDRVHNREGGCRPFIVGTNGESFDKATKGLVDAYPMKDGKTISDATSAYTYDATTFWLNRDPRFVATIAWNGVNWPLNNLAPNKTSVLDWTFQLNAIEAQANDRVTKTGFNCRKAVDATVLGGAESLQGVTDWIEIRYAEVLLNLAEVANEIGNAAEAYTLLGQIRQRAGIDVGGGQYGLAAGMDQSQMRDAVMLERRLELVFEGKRSTDLRRRRLYGTLLNGTHRKGYRISKTAAFDALVPTSEEILDDRKELEVRVLAGTIDLNDPAVYNTYFLTEERSVEEFGNITDNGKPINYLDQYYFFAIPDGDMSKNPALVQTAGWPGGSFDPLQ